MRPEGPRGEHEGKMTEFTPPAVELLLNTEHPENYWPERVAENETFREQVAERRQLIERLDAVFSALPRADMPIEEAVAEGHVDEASVAELYASLGTLLENDSEYRRAALYLPFEVLPKKDWTPKTEVLQKGAETFRDAYKSAWESLLHTHDVRANFVDGDVLEVESRVEDLPRMVKAAHLLPKLIERGVVDVHEAIAHMDTEDETLRHSIAEALPVVADLGLLSKDDLKRLRNSDDELLREAVRQIETMSPEQQTDDTTEFSSATLETSLQTQFTAIESEEYEGVTTKRAAWLRQEKKHRVIEAAGSNLAGALGRIEVADETLEQLLQPDTSAATQQALIAGIREAVESAAHTDADRAQQLVAHYRETLDALWSYDRPGIREPLATTFRHFHGLGLVSEDELNERGIRMPALAGPLSKNLATMEEEVNDVKNMAEILESHESLAESVYPVVLVFGSRLKGYGAENADIDVGVFMKPGTPYGQRGELQASLKDVFTHEKIHGEIVEFWLDETEDGLRVQNFENPDVSLAESSWTHVLFGAAWEGNANTIAELREKLLTPYMYETDERLHDRNARQAYLEELERDTLQYRLMHKGYTRYYPEVGGLKTPHAQGVDGNSTFWDSGYRQTATKLFANRVFLPKIPAPEK